MGRFLFYAAVLSTAVVATQTANAIVLRHDVPDEQSRQLGERHREILVQLALPAAADGAPMLYSGMGALIAPDWVITAAHGTDYLKSALSAEQLKNHFVFIKGRGYRIAEIIAHPGWNGEDNDDIALIRLASPVRDPHPACLYENTDKLGKIVTLVGTGYSGNGREGPRAEPDGALRGATARVKEASEGVIKWEFRSPDNPLATPIEGISGPGDSGGPALIETGGRNCIAGVSSAQAYEIIDANAQAAAARGEGRYGVTEIYMRVSHYAPWIRATIGDAAKTARQQ